MPNPSIASQEAIAGWGAYVLMDPSALWYALKDRNGAVVQNTDVRQVADVAHALEPFLREEGETGATLDEFVPALTEQDSLLGCCHMAYIAHWLKTHRRGPYLAAVDEFIRRQCFVETGLSGIEIKQPAWHRRYIQIFEKIRRERERIDLLFRGGEAAVILSALYVIVYSALPVWKAVHAENFSADLFIGGSLTAASLLLLAFGFPFISRTRQIAVGEITHPSKQPKS